MKFLHTSDWHIGRSLYGRKRYDEFSAFLDWLLEFIKTQEVDGLLVSGDIFDTSMPSNRSQELYYRFLCNAAASDCRHIVIISGNHDSPTFLNAPKMLLKALNIHVISSITENPEDEVICLTGPSGVPEAIVAAVPYLRDRDIRTARAGESLDDKTANLVQGIKAHYETVCAIAREKQAACGNIPIIGMGHLFAAGGRIVDGDGVRELYVGSLAHVGTDVFPACLDYVALGHLHVPQIVGKQPHIRYSGSPIPMGYGEAKQEKKVISIKFDGKSPGIEVHAVPRFQDLERIAGDMEKICRRIGELKKEDSRAWLEIDYTGKEIAGNLRQEIDEAVEGSGMEIRRIKNQRIKEQILHQTTFEETLDNLDVNEVFSRLLDTCEVEEKQRPDLIRAYAEIIMTLGEADKRAE